MHNIICNNYLLHFCEILATIIYTSASSNHLVFLPNRFRRKSLWTDFDKSVQSRPPLVPLDLTIENHNS